MKLQFPKKCEECGHTKVEYTVKFGLGEEHINVVYVGTCMKCEHLMAIPRKHDIRAVMKLCTSQQKEIRV